MSYVVDVLLALALVAGLFVVTCLIVCGLIAIDYLVIKVYHNIIKKLLG